MSTSPRRPSQETTGTLASAIQRAIPSTAKGIVSLALALGGVLGLLFGGVVLLFLRELQGAGYTVLAVGGILLLAGLMLSFTAVRQSVTGRRGRFSTNTIVMIMAFLVLAVLVYAVGARNPVRWDATATKQFSLAPQTVSILEGLKGPVQATAFFVPGDAQQEPYRLSVEGLLDEFHHRSRERLSFRFVDPDVQPTLANRYRVTRYPSVVFEEMDSGRIYRLTVPLFQERDFASAILVVTGVEQKKIYFLTGHAERSIDDVDTSSRQGYGLAATGISTDNYEVRNLALAETPEVPSDTAAIIIAGPRLDLTEGDAELLHRYLKSGGRLLVLLEPNPPQSFKDLLARWGVKVEDGTVVDLGSSISGQPQTPLIKKEQFFSDTPGQKTITSLLDQSYFPGAAAFQPVLPGEEMPDTIRLQPLARTTILSCLTLDPNVNTCPGLSPNLLVPAILVQAIAPMNEQPLGGAPREAKLALFGDADFAANFHLYSLSNSDLLLNTVNWLTEDISLASVRPKPIAFRQLVVTGRQMQLIRGLSWFVLPVAMATLAGIAWWRRR
ncbi:MAG: GldG family protein [Chloroflexi bacterium]|nr:GldG family protein [Chloroflexota bacterium]